ncbi:hypothetical protein [Mongoliimonas terrestris]|uniref:hypothetical protein n=1 Tax=Mongoliimonas terrestris TaxID=1709001 RepID=UPI000949A758|nr:hypothetical protein [Mongoliimonas terrestris]
MPSDPTESEIARRLVAALVDRRLVLAIGRAAVPAGRVPVRLGGVDGPAATAIVAGWTGEAGPGALLLIPVPRGLRGGLTAVAVPPPTPNAVPPHAGEPVPSDITPVLHPVQPKAVAVEAVLKLAAAAAGPAFLAVAGALASALLTLEATAERTRLAAVLAHAAARPSGLVEAVGRFAEGDLLVSGWAGDLPADAGPVLVLGPEPARGHLAALRFPRPDLGDGRRAFAGVVAPSDPAAVLPPAEAVTGVLVETAAGWSALDLYADRRLVPPDACPGHLAALRPPASVLPAAPEPVRRQIAEAACRFTGADTLAGLAAPVRLGLDRAVHVPGGGVMLAGWLFDPEARVAAVEAAGGGTAVRLDDRWTRIARPDVPEGLAADPAIAGRREPDPFAGFLVHAPGLGPAPDLRLTLRLADGEAVHRPVAVEAGTRADLFALLDVACPIPAVAAGAVERHLLPALEGLARALAGTAAPRLQSTRDLGFDAAARSVIVLGCGPDLADLPARLALLAAGTGRDRPAVVVAAPSRPLAALEPEIARAAAYAGCPVRLAFCADAADALDCLDAAVPALQADWIALLPDHVVPDADALARLFRAARAGGPDCVVAPTLLHADGTLRAAGAGRPGRPPEPAGRQGRVAVPRVSAEACVLPRAAFVRAGGFRGPFTGPAARGEDLGRRLMALGLRGLWLPDAVLLAADPPEAVPRIARLADRLLARRTAGATECRPERAA